MEYSYFNGKIKLQIQQVIQEVYVIYNNRPRRQKGIEEGWLYILGTIIITICSL